MALKFRKVEINKDYLEEDNGYEIWELSDNFIDKEGRVGNYYVPPGTDGKDYHDALRTAEQKLMALGLTEIEAKAVIGRQLF
jgi:hypothetical protein